MTLTKEEERWLDEIYHEAASDDPEGPFGPYPIPDVYQVDEKALSLSERLKDVYEPKHCNNHH